jgi:hypothetical protein
MLLEQPTSVQKCKLTANLEKRNRNSIAATAAAAATGAPSQRAYLQWLKHQHL